ALEKVPTTRHGSVFATFARGSAEKPGSHVVRRGETLGEIAKKYNVSLDTLMKKNKIRSARNLHVGRRLAIPGGETAVASVDAEKAEKPKQPSTIEPTQVAKITEKAPKERKSTTRTYRVRRGDTLYDIAKREGLSVKDLQAWNSLGSGAKLRVGDSLYLESKTSVEQAAAPSGPSVANKLSEAKIASSGEKMTHVVKAGEYPAVIAKNYGVKVEELLKWNQLSAKSKIDVGDKLIVYGPKEAAAEEPAKAESSTPEPVVAAAVAAPAKPEPDKLTHKVAQGENPSVIAAKHGVRLNDFLAWNNLTSKSVLHIGDAYVIQPSNAASPPQTIGVNADLTSPAAAAAAEKRPGEKTMHVVAAGQNPTSIARRYGVSLKDLFKWNGWTKDPVLQVGDKVTVYKKK
ncbi:MAG: LysM peptidoglycan-binding domain-containing protein, partial [Candidatus Hydrogenedentes bacterium]|nr:LysM peptidoglycan-binding domain-containing protein [Candidatus Hydrogenedentota bacterium]